MYPDGPLGVPSVLLANEAGGVLLRGAVMRAALCASIWIGLTSRGEATAANPQVRAAMGYAAPVMLHRSLRATRHICQDKVSATTDTPRGSSYRQHEGGGSVWILQWLRWIVDSIGGSRLLVIIT